MIFSPVTLHEAVLSLYVASADGTAPLVEVFIGACAEGIHLSGSLTEFRLPSTGGDYQRTHHVDEEHFIEVRHLFVVRISDPVLFRAVRGQRYVADFLWLDRQHAGLWVRRRYFDVTFMDDRHASGPAAEHGAFEHGMRFRATRFQDATHAATGSGAPAVPVSAAPGGALAAFFREDELAAGDYLLGHYLFTEPVTLARLEARGVASQGSPTVLELEEGGVLNPDGSCPMECGS